MQQPINADEITEIPVNIAVKGGAKISPINDSGSDGDVEQVKSQENTIEWKVPEEDEASVDEPKDHPLKAMGEEIPE